MSLVKSIRLVGGLMWLLWSPGLLALSLEDAVELALESDPWLARSEQHQVALEKRAIAVAELPDPMLRVGFANVPVDTFDLDQEPFTQFQIGLTQSFPRGQSRRIRAEKTQTLAGAEHWIRENRKAEVRLGVTRHWLDLHEVQESIRLIESDRSLFDYLAEATRASYVSAVGRSQQYDVVRAQLEITRLEERLLVLKQREQVLRAALSEWLGPVAMGLSLGKVADIPVQTSGTVLNHPGVKAKQVEIDAMALSVDLEAQGYKPGFALSSSYGRRQDDQLGASRSDFLSISLSFDLPVFTSKKQDQLVDAAQADFEAKRLERDLLFRELSARLLSARERQTKLSARIQLYEERLLDQMSEQADAALTAYTNDTGDFAEVVRARIGELEARLSLLTMQTALQKTRSEIRFYLAGEETSS